MTNKERYIEWVGQQEYIPIYMMPWWMDAVCAGKMWDVLLAEDENGRILGAMPYLLRKRAQFRYIIMPQQTQIGGLWVTAEVTASARIDRTGTPGPASEGFGGAGVERIQNENPVGIKR